MLTIRHAGKTYYEMSAAELLARGVPQSVIDQASMPELTETQWSFLLDLTGFGQAVTSALDAMPKDTAEERATWAGMRAVSKGLGGVQFDNVRRLVARVRDMDLPDVTVPTDEEIEAAWPQAAQFKGAASL